MKYLLHIIHFILKACRFLPVIGEPIRAIIIDQDIRKLEGNNDFETARKIRHQALSQIAFKHQGPLLRSEGEDRLYRMKDYQGALEAFEKAIDTLDISPFTYGVSSPDRIYAGASQAAVLLGDKEKATKYYLKFKDIFTSLDANPKLKNSLAWHRDTLDWLNTKIATLA